MFDRLTTGLSAEQVITVSDDLTAQAIGSGDLPVYATPAMIALMEATSVIAIENFLPPGYSTVGIEINVKHVAATPVGEEVRVQAEVIDIEGKRIVFNVQAWDDEDLIGEGTHVRYIIEIERFMQRVARKRA